MDNPTLQRVYSQIVVRGYRNAPTYNEVKRDLATRRVDPLFGYRY